MVAIASLLVVIALSLLVVRIGTIALTMTGLAEDVARFQALSAYSGAGFTTDESERAVEGPARRRILAVLIRAGSVGVVGAVSTSILSFVGADEAATLDRLVVLGAGVAILVALARSDRLNRWVTPLIWAGLQRTTALDLRDYAHLLHSRDDWRVGIIDMHRDSWLAGGRLDDLRPWEEGVTVLGVERRDGGYAGPPAEEVEIEPGDRVILYGRTDRLEELSRRDAGDRVAHERAKREHREAADDETPREVGRAPD